jgi:dihydrolipoamide dehydrogenase
MLLKIRAACCWTSEEASVGEVKQYDLAVIGAGPGGYVAAIRAAQLGMNVAVIEKMESFGGTCLNVGCIPSKALLDSAAQYHSMHSSAAEHGISVKGLDIDLGKTVSRKAGVVKKLTDGVAGLLKGNKVSRIQGIAMLNTAGSSTDGGHLIDVFDNPRPQWDSSLGGIDHQTGSDADAASGSPREQIRASKVILATGSLPVELPFIKFDGNHVISSTGALCLDEAPRSMVIIGAGAIGLEMASVWASFGVKVTVVEMMKQILPGWDSQTARSMMRELKNQGIEFLLNNSVTEAKVLKSGVRLKLAAEPGELKADKVLVAVGRRPALETAGIKEAGIALTEDGRRISVNENYETSVAGIYAIGDLVPGPMLAHKAEDEAVVAVERMNGIPAHLDYGCIPGVVYTHPEAAGVGATEDELKSAKTPYRKGVFNLAANGRALAMGSSAGFVKILADEQSDRILGAQIVGPWASDLIAEIVAVMEMKGSSEDIARIVHAHPTLPEAVREAAMAVHGRSIHSLR